MICADAGPLFNPYPRSIRAHRKGQPRMAEKATRTQVSLLTDILATLERIEDALTAPPASDGTRPPLGLTVLADAYRKPRAVK